MKCPYCGHTETSVVDSRDANGLSAVRRRRECVKCGKRFTTYERIESVELAVIKKDGRREPFNREKIMAGIIKACEKRPISHDKIEKAVDEIEMELRKKDTKEVPSSLIGELVMKKLKRLDKVAYIRFASVYREFADVEDFRKELKRLLKNEK
ncbi:MAG: transcriptional regulator NrdR [Candidatus Micrarchaeia archaeon]